MKIIEEKDKVQAILSEGDKLEVSSSKKEKLLITLLDGELQVENLNLKTILEKSEEEKAIKAMQDYMKDEE